KLTATVVAHGYRHQLLPAGRRSNRRGVAKAIGRLNCVTGTTTGCPQAPSDKELPKLLSKNKLRIEFRSYPQPAHPHHEFCFA
ncbi:MAG TPA: hypothetical protein VNL70_05760, partial [Tepidisphaeraceae bacterium]|nr:hypothetical protein [Tepidisphaeraceae bacterium]